MVRSACFIQGSVGQIFCVQWYPSPRKPKLAPFVLVPPFGEEMNKSRHVMAALGRALAESGHPTVCFDPFGTGDSEGDFSEATLEHWRRDIDCVIDAFAHGRTVSLVGFRAGALLSAEAAVRHDCKRLVLIQPLAEGRQQLNQILRLRVAAGISGGARETTGGLNRKLEEDGFLEVAGYSISAELANGLGSLSLADNAPSCVEGVRWLELVAQQDRPLMPQSRKLIDQWMEAGVNVDASVVACDQFWATQELADCPGVVEAVATWVGASI